MSIWAVREEGGSGEGGLGEGGLGRGGAVFWRRV